MTQIDFPVLQPRDRNNTTIGVFLYYCTDREYRHGLCLELNSTQRLHTETGLKTSGYLMQSRIV